ncbi:hypothetical protein FD755_002874 [Muntiacus reevesi]|uniref:Uncharacterized protein n=1 Tax=Muntiacus reevesi TaxID=9886 RepID=A0A5J5N5I9_MUNRE|nr:hypothetical protein FD755_002874 [Muntiacus reevesi]
MKRTASGSCCRRRCDCGCCRRAVRRTHHAPYWSRDAARTPPSSRQSPGRERRHPEPAGSWAAAAEEEEAAAAAAPWMRPGPCLLAGWMMPSRTTLKGITIMKKSKINYCPERWKQARSSHYLFFIKILEWVAISCSKGSSWPRNQT